MAEQVHDLDQLARQYVRLVLSVGHHDPDYVDAFYGPAELKDGTAAKSLLEIQREAAGLLASMRAPVPAGTDQMPRIRRRYLIRQLECPCQPAAGDETLVR
jgi:hypothetical protein